MSNAMTEFKITSDLSALRGQVIEANFDEVRSWLDENLEPYRNMTVTEDMVSTAKSYRANIRKVADRIDSSRKEAKAAALAAYTDFETKCKTLTGLCADAANAIDAQIKAYENAEKQAKIAELRAEYDAGETEAKLYCPWERVFNPKWENKGYAIEDAKEEIRSALYDTEVNLESIRKMGGDDTAYLLDIFKTTHDINAVIRKSIEIQTAKEREAQRRREADEAKRRAEEDLARKRAKDAKPAPEARREEQEAVETFEPEKPELVTVDFRVTCSRGQLAALGSYMKQNGIRYGRVSDDG